MKFAGFLKFEIQPQAK